MRANFHGRPIYVAAAIGWSLAASLPGATPAATSAPEPIRHRFVCADNSGRTAKLIHVDENRPEANWVVDLPGEAPRDLQWIPPGRVLVSLSRGFGEYDLDTGKVLRRVAGFKGITTARRLANDHTLLAGMESNSIVVHEVDAEDRCCADPRRIPCAGQPLRQMRVLSNGNLLLHVAADTVAEVDPAGRTVWTLRLPADIPGTKGTLAERLQDGSTLVGLGNGLRVAQYDEHGNTLRFWGKERKSDHPEWKLDYISGFDPLPNGHVVLCNWQGHLPAVDGPHLVEFDQANRLVWQWNEPRLARQVTHVLVLDRYAPAPVSATTGQRGVVSRGDPARLQAALAKERRGLPVANPRRFTKKSPLSPAGPLGLIMIQTLDAPRPWIRSIEHRSAPPPAPPVANPHLQSLEQ